MMFVCREPAAPKVLKALLFTATTFAVSALVYGPPVDRNDLPNRVPEAAPYVTAEAQFFPPPFEKYWEQQDNPSQCRTCHRRIFDQWNGSMMSNAWRDPVWRGAFLLAARETSANGECDTPEPPDGTPKAHHNPFAKDSQCASSFDIGSEMYTVSRPGSLLDGFCSRCHMPSNYVDNVPLHAVNVDTRTGVESASVDTRFDPTSDNGTGFAFATLESQYRNTDTGKSGVFCTICHTLAETRDTPFHNYVSSKGQYAPALGKGSRSDLLPISKQDMFRVPDQTKRNLGYSIGSGSYRLSPHAIGFPERLGPLTANDFSAPIDSYLSEVFNQAIPYQHMDSSRHRGFHHALFARGEMCAACHDVTNPLPVRNGLGKWVGGFPIERTYTEWANSRYADRPGNANFDPHFKRDCQTCHMQQDYGQPGTAQTLYYKDGRPLSSPSDRVASDGATHPFFTHHFVGGNAYVTRMIGRGLDVSGNVSSYPELSTFSFSSADKNSPYFNAYWTRVEDRGAYAQQARLAWDRLRHVLSLDIQGPRTIQDGSSAPLLIIVANTGSGHNFPTGFPEGRTAWLSVRASDLATGQELPVHDSFWNRTSLGVGNLTREEMADPNFPERCNWKIPPGSVDPYSVQFKAIASGGDGCPTLDVVYATPLNLVTNAEGLPIDEKGNVIDKANPGRPQFRDVNNNGDFFDDSYLRDTRLKPMPHKEATATVDRYSIVIPPGTQGPVAVTAAVYYQSVEAMVALKFLGNLADTNNDFVLEPCVLGGLCDGRKPNVEPAVVEGAPPVPMVVQNWVITIAGTQAKRTPPRLTVYPWPGARNVYQDAVVKASFSEPVVGVNGQTYTLVDSRGSRVPTSMGQIGDGTWALFPDQVFLKAGQTYTARLKRGICSVAHACTAKDVVWSFTVATTPGQGNGDTSVPMGFSPQVRDLAGHKNPGALTKKSS